MAEIIKFGTLCFDGQPIGIAVESLKGGYQEHWKKGGRWVDDAGLTRWVENDCKAAASIEDIIGGNIWT